MSEQRKAGWLGAFSSDCAAFWRQMPDKGVWLALVFAWALLFHFWGNSTLGYVNTHSMFGWMRYAYGFAGDDDVGRWIPLLVLGLIYWKREVLLAVPKAPWWPGLLLLAAAILLHIAGYFVQQTRISILAFFLGLYALGGVVWGPKLLKATFFPFILFVFCMPLSSEAERITLPMRLWATSITAAVCSGLGINLIQDGTRIFDPSGTFQYEVAVACSGIRSLTATLTLAVIYAFVGFRSTGRRLLMIASAFPLAIVSNVFRLSLIIIVAEAFGQKAGDYVHNNTWLSLLPYVPAFMGLALLGRVLRESDTEPAAGPGPVQQTA